MTDTVGLLNSIFTGRTAETTLLFAREETFRSSSLANATVSDTQHQRPDGQHPRRRAGAGVYELDALQYSGGSWNVCNSQDDIKRLKLELAKETFFQPLPTAATTALDESQRARS